MKKNKPSARIQLLIRLSLMTVWVVASCFIFVFNSYGQIQEKYYQSFLSPNAAGLYRHENVPAHMYSGVIDLNIPLYAIEEDYMTLGLSLSYHSGGNKVEDIAPWTGLGWNLTGIPRISRQVRGLPDEEGVMYKYNGKTLEQYFNYMTDNERLNMSIAVAEGVVDTELDVYHLSINGFSGKFYYDQTSNTFLTERITNIKINHVQSTNNFEVIDESGVVYKFNMKEYVTVNEVSAGKQITTSWLASEVSYPSSSNKIVLSYTNENHLYMKIGTQYKYITLGIDNSYPFDHFNDTYETKLVDARSLNLSSITFSKGQVNFIKSTAMREDLQGGYALKGITISNKKNEIIKDIELTHTYKSGNGYSNYGSNKWMFLSRVDVHDVSGVNGGESYQLEYADKVPASRLSYSQDYWGYHNNQTSNTSLTPTSSFVHPNTGNTVVVSGANRLVNSNYADFGILKKITYPTGGYSDFFYESNSVGQGDVPSSYKQEWTYIAAEGGDPSLPVQPNQAQFIEQFTVDNPPDGYLNGNNSNGGAFVTTDVANLGVTPGSYGATLTLKGISGTNSNININFSSSFNNYYLPNGTYELKGVFDQDPPNYMDFHCFVRWYSLEPSLGGDKLTGGLRIKEIKAYSSTGSISSITEYKYINDWGEEKSSGKLFGSSDLGFGSFVRKNGYYYSPVLDRYFPTGADYFRIKAYPNIEMITQNASYSGYSSVYEVKKSGDVSSIEQYLYSNHPDEINPVPPFLPAQSLQEHNGKIMEKRQYSLSGNQPKLLSKEVFNYLFSFHPKAFYNLYPYFYDPGVFTPYLPGQLSTELTNNLPVFYGYFFERVQCLPINKTVYMYHDGQATVERSESYSFNNQGQLLQTELRDSNGKIERKKFYYPNTLVLSGAHESARAWMQSRNMFNSLLKEEQYQVEGTTELLLRSSNLLYKQFNGAPDAIYKDRTEFREGAGQVVSKTFHFLAYDSYGNPLEVKQQEGPSTVYLWGYGGQYPIAKIENASYNEVKAALSDASGTFLNQLTSKAAPTAADLTRLNGLRNHSTMRKAQVSTYTYKPLVGMASMTDPRGITETYQYDGFQRLKQVLDFENNILQDYRYHYRP